VTLTFDLLTLNNCCVWRVTWSTLPPSLKTLCLSVLELWVITFPVDCHWKCVRGYCACTESRDPPVGGQKTITFLGSPTLICIYSLCTFGGSTMNVIKVICENNARPCVKKRMRFCAWAKSRDLLKGALYVLWQPFSTTSIYRTTVLDFKSWAYSHIYGHFQQHFYCACAETVIYELPV